MLATVILRGYTGISFEIPAKKERVIVPNLFGDLLDRIVAFEQTPAGVVDSFPSQPIDRS
jgi:hypothetical protein